MQQHKYKDDRLWELTKGYKQDYTPDVEKGLESLKAQMAQSASPTSVISMRTWLVRAASIAVLVLGAVFLYQQLLPDEAIALEVIESNEEATVGLYQLPDGTQIWLNKNSKLSYPAHFSDTERIVQLEGEAYLKVVSNPSNPFIVQTKETAVKVLGTAFSVRAYPDAAAVTVAVEEGTVAFEAKATGKQLILQAQQKGTYQKKEQALVESSTHAMQDLAWKEQKLVFDDTALPEIFSYLNTQFDISILTNKDLTNCNLTATFVENTPEAILNRITSTFPIMEIKQLADKKYQLSGACK